MIAIFEFQTTQNYYFFVYKNDLQKININISSHATTYSFTIARRNIICRQITIAITCLSTIPVCGAHLPYLGDLRTSILFRQKILFPKQ